MAVITISVSCISTEPITGPATAVNSNEAPSATSMVRPIQAIR